MSISLGEATAEVAFLFDEIILWEQRLAAGLKMNPSPIIP